MLRKNAVVDQNANNFLKTTKHEMGCCDGTELDCQYTAAYTQANSVTLLTILEDGAAVALPLVIAGAATAATAQAAVLATLIAAGYYDDDNVNWPGVVVTDLGTTLQVVITGDINVVSLTTSGGVVTFEADCTRTNLCTFTIDGNPEGATQTLRINGADTALGAYTSGTTDVEDFADLITTALTAAGLSGSATVTDNPTPNTYDVVITGVPSTTTLSINGSYAVISDCVQVYV